jgi:D-glycero-D-manno-heptose 1,7-bisphosphate phosphatase
MTGRPAVFLDRDGTIIEDRHYLRHPAELRMLPGAAGAVRELNEAGIPAVLVSNQSGIARGLLTETDYEATARRLDELLEQEHARLDARYHCPHLPEITGPCDCRKPGALLFERAALDLGLDLSRSWWVGDRLRDLEAARRFGGRGLLVLTGAGPGEAGRPEARDWPTAPDLVAAVRRILSSSA